MCAAMWTHICGQKYILATTLKPLGVKWNVVAMTGFTLSGTMFGFYGSQNIHVNTRTQGSQRESCTAVTISVLHFIHNVNSL